MGYSAGKFAIGLCDRCGFEYKLHDLRKEWNNLKTCTECFEPKAPQIDPTPVVSDKAGEGFVVVSDANNFTNTSNNFLSMNSSILGSNYTITKMTASLGSVTITT